MSTDSTDGRSIKAAWDAHLAHLRDGHGHLPAGTVVTACCEPTARDYGQAVLDALAMYVIDEAVLEGVRAEIEALGSSMDTERQG